MHSQEITKSKPGTKSTSINIITSQLNTTTCSVPPVGPAPQSRLIPDPTETVPYSFFIFTAVANRVLGRGCSPTPYNRDIEPIKRTIITITVPESKTNGLSQRIEPQNQYGAEFTYPLMSCRSQLCPAHVTVLTLFPSPVCVTPQLQIKHMRPALEA